MSGKVSGAAALGDVFSGDQLREEAAHEGVSGAVGVHQLLLRKGDHRVQRHLRSRGEGGSEYKLRIWHHGVCHK